MRIFWLGLLALVAVSCGGQSASIEASVAAPEASSAESDTAAEAAEPADEPEVAHPAAEGAADEAMADEAMEDEEAEVAMEDETMQDEAAEAETASVTGTPPSEIDRELFPVVVDATAFGADESWNVSVTLSSEYDSPERYADAWRVLDASGTELGIRILTHDHANEQPFTRSHSVDIPTDVDVVYIEGRDQDNGWSGERFQLTLER